MIPQFLILYFIIYFICTTGKIINNEEEFIENINKKSESFNIQNKITIEKKGKIDITSTNFLLIGDSINSEIHMINTDISFDEKCENIEIRNITVNGNLKFSNNKNIIFNNVNYNGYFISNNKLSDFRPSFNILNSNFTLPEKNHGYDFKNYNLNIENSKFYGNNIYNLYIIDFLGDGRKYHSFNIKNSFFSGNYHNSGIKSRYSNFTCQYSRFENLYNGKFSNGYDIILIIKQQFRKNLLF